MNRDIKAADFAIVAVCDELRDMDISDGVIVATLGKAAANIFQNTHGNAEEKHAAVWMWCQWVLEKAMETPTQGALELSDGGTLLKKILNSVEGSD